MTDTIRDNITAAIAELKAAGDLPKSFWTHGEIPDKIGYVATDSKVIMRHNRLRQWLLGNGHPCHDPELRNFCLWAKLSIHPWKVPVAGFKYLLLKEAEAEGEEWSLKMDAAAEKLAWDIVREHKEKLRDTGE